MWLGLTGQGWWLNPRPNCRGAVQAAFLLAWLGNLSRSAWTLQGCRTHPGGRSGRRAPGHRGRPRRGGDSAPGWHSGTSCDNVCHRNPWGNLGAGLSEMDQLPQAAPRGPSEPLDEAEGQNGHRVPGIHCGGAELLSWAPQHLIPTGASWHLSQVVTTFHFPTSKQKGHRAQVAEPRAVLPQSIPTLPHSPGLLSRL